MGTGGEVFALGGDDEAAEAHVVVQLRDAPVQRREEAVWSGGEGGGGVPRHRGGRGAVQDDLSAAGMGKLTSSHTLIRGRI